MATRAHAVYEMVHRLPSPLKDRVFPVLVVSAQTGESSFIVVQIPISASDLQQLPTSVHCKNRGMVVGVYTSVEYVYRQDNGFTEWIMATSSDAGGNIPLWLQEKAIPSAIAKDVPLFLQWVKDRRRNGGLGQRPGKPKRFGTLTFRTIPRDMRPALNQLRSSST